MTKTGKSSSKWGCILVFILLGWIVLAAISSVPGGDPNHRGNRLIRQLRDLKVAAIMFLYNNSDKLDTIKLEIELLAPYLDSVLKYINKPEEYLFIESDGKWWVGHNLAVSGCSSQDRKAEAIKLNAHVGKAIFGSMDVNIPYDGEDIVFMLVK